MEDNYPKAKIDYRSAKGVTGKIEVSWIKGGKKEIVVGGSIRDQSERGINPETDARETVKELKSRV